MDLYGQEQYEELDWITKAEAPLEYKSNVILNYFDEKTEIPHEFIMKEVISSSWSEFHLFSAIRYACQAKNITYHGEVSNHIHDIGSCFKLVLDGEPIELDVENDKITGGKVYLIKTKNYFEEEELLKQIKDAAYALLRRLEKNSVSRMNDILELLGDQRGRKNKSMNIKMERVRVAYGDIVKDNKWNVKNGDILIHAAGWIKDYINTGNTASYANFCKLKVMTHGNVPIYKMEEVE